MVSQLTHVHREGTGDISYWLNSSGETVPAFGVIEVVSFNSTALNYVVIKPTGSANFHLFNGPTDILAGKYGSSLGFHTGPQPVLFDSSVPPPNVGATVGPVGSEWFVSGDGSGFKLITNVFSSGVGAIVEQPAAAAAGSGFFGITNSFVSRSSGTAASGKPVERLAFITEGSVSLKRTGDIGTVYNHYNHIDMEIDTIVRVEFDAALNRFIFVGADCAPVANPESFDP